MAGIRKLKNNYYARVLIPRSRQRPKDKLVSLCTGNRREAAIRRLEVERHESEIKAGIEFGFPWQNNNGHTKVIRLNTGDAVTRYLKARKVDKLRQSTQQMYKLALNHFIKVVGKTTPVEVIDSTHIEKFKLTYEKKHSDTTVNINLRAIRPFLNWLHERGELKSVPKIAQINTGKPLPIYLSNTEFAEIQKVVAQRKFKNHEDNVHYQRAFYFYRETGVRLSEPFYGTLHNDWLVIEAEFSKTHRTRELFLTPELLQIVHELRDRFERYTGKSKADYIKRYSRVFWLACIEAKIHNKKFHCLRHTFAVRRYLVTRDIYQVARELGHADLKTTQRYANFNFMRLAQDFPDLAETYNGTKNRSTPGGADTENADTEREFVEVYRR